MATQMFLGSEALVGPLSVLCGTWNVGNAMPPDSEELLTWLAGCDE
jgi:hypothetical protein